MQPLEHAKPDQIRTTICTHKEGEKKVVNLFGDGSVIELHEYTKLHITVSSDSEAEPVVTMGDYEVQFQQSESGDWYSTNHSPFANQMGVTTLTLSIGDMVYESRPINIFASKLTYEKAVQFLRFLTIEAADISTLCFSTSKLNSDAKTAKADLFTRKLEAGTNTTRFLIEHAQRFFQDPIFNQQQETVIEKHQSHTPIDQKGINFLASNPNQLIKTDALHSQLKVQGRYFQIDNIARQKVKKGFNTYENRVIIYFLINFENFLKQSLLKLASNDTFDNDVITVDDKHYFSFDRLLDDTGISLKLHEAKIKKSMLMAKKARQIFEKHFPVKLIEGKSHMPTPTSKALLKGHYRMLFKLATKYFRAEEPSWSGDMDFFGLRNLSKVYEIVCLYSLIKALISNNCTLQDVQYMNWATIAKKERPENNPFNYFKFTTQNGKRIELYYEPWVRPKEGVLNFNTHGLVDVSLGVTYYNGRAICWKPDFLIKETHDDGREYFHVLDAKYSRRGLVNNKITGSLAECTNKYILGIRTVNSFSQPDVKSMIDSMHILYSDTSNTNYFSHTRHLFNLSNSNSTSSHIRGMSVSGSIPVAPDHSRMLNNLVESIIN